MKKVVSVIMILCLSAGLSGMNPQDREIADVVKPCVDQAINDAVGRYCVQAVVREAEWPVHMLKLSIKHAGLRSDAAVRLQEIKDVCLSAESELDSAKYMLVGGQQAHAVLQKVLRECAHQVELCDVSSDASIAVLQESFKKLSQLLDNDRSHVQKQIDLVVAQEQDQRNQARELLAKAASQAVEVAERKVRDTHYASMRAALEKNIHHKVAHVAAREQYRKQAIAAADNARAQAQRKAELQELAAREKKAQEIAHKKQAALEKQQRYEQHLVEQAQRERQEAQESYARDLVRLQEKAKKQQEARMALEERKKVEKAELAARQKAEREAYEVEKNKRREAREVEQQKVAAEKAVQNRIKALELYMGKVSLVFETYFIGSAPIDEKVIKDCLDLIRYGVDCSCMQLYPKDEVELLYANQLIPIATHINLAKKGLLVDKDGVRAPVISLGMTKMVKDLLAHVGDTAAHAWCELSGVDPSTIEVE